MLRQGKLFDSLSDLAFAIRELHLQQSFRYQDRLKSIIESACGDQGVLSRHIIHHLVTPPSIWATQQDQLLEYMGPQSDFQQRLADSANLHTNINTHLIPKNLQDDFPKHASFESKRMTGLRRDAAGTLTVGLWDWFWSNVIHALLQLKELESTQSVQQSDHEDELYHHLSRNFYLLLIQKTLNRLVSRKPQLHSRLIFIIESHVLQELFFKIRGKKSDVRYRLKSQHLYLLYLLIHGRSLNDETVHYYYDYLQLASENYSSIAGTQGNNVRNLMRVWLALATRQTGIGSVLLDKLDKANNDDGIYRLARCPSENFALAMVRVNLGSRQLTKAMNCRGQVLKLLKKVSEWNADYSHLAVIEQYLIFDEKVLSKLQFPQEEWESELIGRSVERVLLKLAEGQVEVEQLKQLHHRMNSLLRSREKGATSLHVSQQSLIERRQQPQQGDLSQTSLNRRGGISYYNPRRRNVWAYPLQENEFYILFKAMLWLAELIDKLLPGHSQRRYPLLNLRIFCNPTVFIGVILIGVLVYRLML